MSLRTIYLESSMPTLSYQLGHALGVLVREIRDLQRELRDSLRKRQDKLNRSPINRHDFDTIPAIVRSGVRLKEWYEDNVYEIEPEPEPEPEPKVKAKRVRKASKAPKRLSKTAKPSRTRP
jgi:hypothetical protein